MVEMVAGIVTVCDQLVTALDVRSTCGDEFDVVVEKGNKVSSN